MEQIKVKQLPTVQAGVVVYSGEPYYYIEKLSIGNDAAIFAYNLSEKSIRKFRVTHDYKDLQKEYRIYKKSKYKIRPNSGTPLAKQLLKVLGGANSKKNLTSYYKYKYQLPLFISNLTMNTDTMTGYFETGFEEQENTYIGALQRDSQGRLVQVFPKMKPTGVFIGESHIKWIDYKVNLKGLLSFLTDMYSVYSERSSFIVPSSSDSYQAKNKQPTDPKSVVADSQ